MVSHNARNGKIFQWHGILRKGSENKLDNLHDRFRVLAVFADHHIAVVVKGDAAHDGGTVLGGDLIGIENGVGGPDS